MIRLSLIVVCGYLLTATALQAADQWTEFRGPDGQGRATAKNLPVDWSPTDNVVWKQEIPGQGWSSPVVYRGRVYLTAAVPRSGSDYDLTLFMLDAATGRFLKRSVLFKQQGATAPRIHRKNSHASPTPLIAKDRIFVHFGHQGTACVDLNLGAIWSTRELRYPPVHGNGGTPILVGGKLIFSCDGARDPFIVALNAADGKVAWKRPRVSDAQRKFSFSTPQAIEVNGKLQVVSPGSNMVAGLDPQTGRQIWHVRYNGYSVIPRPVVGHGLVFVCTGYGTPNLLAIRPDGQGDVTDTHVAWQTRQSVPHTPSLLLVGDNLFMVSDRGIATCLDAKTGNRHWRERLPGAYSASPLFAEGRIYFQNESGRATIIEASSQFNKLGDNDLGERSLASYAAIDGALFVRTQPHLYRIGRAASGE